MSTQAKFFTMPNPFSLRDWRQYGEQLMRASRDMQFDLGDWLLEGKEQGRLEHAVLKAHAESITGIPLGTLQNYMRVSKAFLPVSRRRENLSFSMHEAVAKFEQEVQERLLDEAVDRQYSVRAFQDAIDRKQQNGEIPKDAPKANPKKDELLSGAADKVAFRTIVLASKFTGGHSQLLSDAAQTIWREDSHTCNRAEILHTLTCFWVRDNLEFLLGLASQTDERWAKIGPKLREVLTNPKGYHDWMRVADSPWYKLSCSPQKAAADKEKKDETRAFREKHEAKLKRDEEGLKVCRDFGLLTREEAIVKARTVAYEKARAEGFSEEELGKAVRLAVAEFLPQKKY